MTDTALKNAEARLREAQAKMRKAEQELKLAKEEVAQAKAFISAWHDFAEVPLPRSPKFVEKESLGTPTRFRTFNPRKEDVADAAREIIEEKGRPVSRAEMRSALSERGITIHGTDPNMVLSTMLWRMPQKVVRLKKHGYWLTEKPYAPAAYFPEVNGTRSASE